METCWKLTQLSNIGGGGDNITSVFARLHTPLEASDTLQGDEAISKYRFIDGCKYSSRLLNAADTMLANQQNNQITLENVEHLLSIIDKEHSYNDLSKNTLAYLQKSEEYKCTETAQAFLSGVILSWRISN